MRSRRIILGLSAWLAVLVGDGFAQDKPAVHETRDFMTKGVLTALDGDLTRHQLTFQEVQAAGLDGRPTPIADILAAMAKYEKLRSHVDEPLEVRGNLPVTLTPNTSGDEMFTTGFMAITYNGLVIAGRQGEMVLVRPETRPELVAPRRRWDQAHILSARLFRLGYLAPDPILRHYQEKIGTREGHAVIVVKANVLIVVDTDAALEALGSWIDAETVAAMGESASGVPNTEPRPPSLGAVASRDCIHFYLLASARSHGLPTFATEQRGTASKSYPEAGVWLSDRAYQALREQYRQVNAMIPVAQEAVAQGWIDPHPERVLTPAAQKRLEIRFGLVTPLPGAERAKTTKKPARRKR